MGSPDSTFLIVYSPVADCYRGQWSFKRVNPGVYTVGFFSRDDPDQPSDWFLTARRSQKQDKRSKETTYAIVHQPLDDSYVSCWQFLEGSESGKYRICIADYRGGAFSQRTGPCRWSREARSPPTPSCTRGMPRT